MECWKTFSRKNNMQFRKCDQEAITKIRRLCLSLSQHPDDDEEAISEIKAAITTETSGLTSGSR